MIVDIIILILLIIIVYIFSFLKKNNVKPKEHLIGTKLHELCLSEDNLEEIICFLESTDQIKSSDNAGYTPLHDVCNLNNQLIIEIMLPYIDRELLISKNRDGKTPIHLLAEHEDTLEICQKLLAIDYRCLRVRDKYGELPYDVAFGNDFMELVEEFTKSKYRVGKLTKAY